MSRYNIEKLILDAGERWKKVALQSDGAVFAQEPVWTLPYLQDLKQHFIDQPDEGDGDFFDKLKRQLDPAKSEVKQLAAEMLWFMYLCPSPDQIKASTKIGQIRRVWGWSDESFPENNWVSDVVLGGVGSGGPSFISNRQRELVFFIHMVTAFKSLAGPKRSGLLSDGWKFAQWLENIPECNSRQLRHMIVFLLFPDNFDHIFGGTHRCMIVQKFTGKTDTEVKKMSALEIDRALFDIRDKKEEEYDTKNLDFYDSPLYELWQDSKPENDSVPEPDSQKSEANTLKHPYPLNQILYGPPGTGKTWNTVNRAVAIIGGKSGNDLKEEIRKINEGESLADFERDKIKERFDKLKKYGRIAMVTFHQNFTYEDFIEGIRPVLAGDESENVKYELSEGVFRKIVERAAKNRTQSEQTGDKSWDMDELFQAFAKSIEEKLKIKKEINLFPPDHRSGATIKQINWSADDKFQSFMLGGTRKSGRLAKDVIKRDYEAFCEGEIKSRTDIRPTRGSKQTEHERARYLFPLFQMIKQFHDEDWKPKKLIEKQNYVLIIDEINRGNIAKIFGELITLIEPSKRIGGDDAATVTLPYSKDPKEEFGVPDNLYIIGTMNTADRSIALLDTALRRRFEFIEMMPDSKLVSDNIDDVDCQKLLDAMNDRIHFLLDREHQIGHTYFMDVKRVTGKDSLEVIFKNKIIPLLQEYFYDDWKKIDLVLNGNGFIEDKSEKLRKDILEKLPENKKDLGDLIDEERKIYELSDDAGKWEDPKSYQAIYEKGQGETGEAG